MQPVNLNALLADCITKGDQSSVEQLVQCSLDPIKTLQLVRNNRQYALLHTLSPILNFNQVGVEALIQGMYLDALYDNDPVAIETLYAFRKYNVCQLSSLCGEHGYNPDLLVYGFDLCSYLSGIIQVDDLDSFLAAQEKYSPLWTGNKIAENGSERDVHELLAHHFAPKIMDHLGYDDLTMTCYLSDIAYFGNEKLLAHLWPKENTQRIFYEVLCIKRTDYRLPIVKWVLAQGFNFDQAWWQRLKGRMPDVYEACSQDV